MTTNTFRSPWAETIFNNRYRHDGCETWDKLARVLVEDVCQDQLSKSDKAQLAEYIATMRFIPGGRYLYYAGRPNRFYNNCFASGTKVLTDKGWRNVEDAGQANVLSPVTGEYLPAEFHAHGEQPVYEYTFAHNRGKSKQTFKIKATRNHKWLLSNGASTEEMTVGDLIPSQSFALRDDDLGFYHGFMFGDGSAKGQLRLCGNKSVYLDRLSRIADTVTYPKHANGDACLYSKRTIEWKKLPNTEEVSGEYTASFIKGWIAADGGKAQRLTSVHRENLEWFQDYAAYAGLVASGEIRTQIRTVKLGIYEYEDHQIHIQCYKPGDEWAGFKCVSIEHIGNMPVFCPFEPKFNQIVIDHNIRTFQCYLLKAEEDTRQDWADLSWKSESCLMTGGGIGVDYSVYRPEGSKIARTGGVASGPISKMEMINEIGRKVMQGGSRRSAIYASLNWQHGDIDKFLKAKDWQHKYVPGTSLSLKDVKAIDFNWPAPLDMTNISVNYDDAWLLSHDRASNPVFLENVRQALETGEPGFSFNFGNQQNETLRNACTEVTSSDDSDVCNLGSINLGRISSLSELASVVELATKFLVCGTLRADLPYDRVYRVRERNRRLGLGLMGLHEWLIKRGERYEVTAELHRWLEIYRSVSDRTSSAFADDLGISRPVANRAIAPTGTIGILAGTTTGIEPLFAVAYKRRYLKNGTDWHYQYVIDSAAQELMDLYGIDPSRIESSIDLADQYERRIAVQANVQDYVDMAISSTINLPAWGTEGNNEDLVRPFAETLARYAPRLRGFTCYPDGSRGGQPLTSVPYQEAAKQTGIEFKEHDVCDISGKGGTCGV